MEKKNHFDCYEKEIASARLAFASKIKPILQECDSRKFLIFWINFSSLGIKMTELVEDWIRRAGLKTEALGYIALGKKLIKHAVHEKNHHFMMIKDSHKLVNIWNQNYAPPYIDVQKLLSRKLKKSVLDYQQLHEDCINGDFPFSQIAIEYEIENLSTVHGPVVTANAISIFGETIKSCLTFIFDHVAIDQAHTVYNQKALKEFLDEYPESLESLIKTGSLALEIYGNFMRDCYHSLEFFELSALAV